MANTINSNNVIGNNNIVITNYQGANCTNAQVIEAKGLVGLIEKQNQLILKLLAMVEVQGKQIANIKEEMRLLKG